MKSLSGAFDKLGSQGNVLGQIAVNTENTAVSLAVGGEFYDRMDAMATAIEDIRDGKVAQNQGWVVHWQLLC